MQFSLPPPSLTPHTGLAPASVMGPQGTENYAESGIERSGVFALILGQLNLLAPASSTPGDPGTAMVNAELPAQIAAGDVPLTGNPLPLVLPQTSGEALPPLSAAEVAEPGDALLPLPVLPQPLPAPRSPQPAGLTVARPTTSVSASASTSTPELTGEPVPPRSVVVRDAPVAPGTPGTELPAPDKLLAVRAPDDFVVPERNATAPSPTVAPAPSLNHAQAPAAPTASTPPQQAYSLNQPVADPRWGTELGQRLIWMNEQGIGRAELRMNPPELGPVEVRIAVSNDDARVIFHVQHGATREALESAMPRLREMFAAQGLNLSDASVSEQSANGRQQAGQSEHDSSDSHGDGALGPLAGDLTDAPGHVRAMPLDGTIDAYA